MGFFASAFGCLGSSRRLVNLGGGVAGLILVDNEASFLLLLSDLDVEFPIMFGVQHLTKGEAALPGRFI